MLPFFRVPPRWVQALGGLLAALLLPLAAAPAGAQSQIAAGAWQGFTSTGGDGRLALCALYNRTAERINENPYEMLGLTRDAAGHVGLMVFFRPGALTRGTGIALTLKIDDRPPVMLTGDVPSDFHIRISGPLAPDLVGRLREARKLEAATQGRTIGFAVDGVGDALDALTRCIENRKQ